MNEGTTNYIVGKKIIQWEQKLYSGEQTIIQWGTKRKV
jgi:hypothetical protein